MTAAIGHLLASARLIICVGSGGAGKTTTAAALALRAARQGRKAAVVTIDPARRLANALGVKELGNVAAPVSLVGLPTLAGADTGALHAMMLDQKDTWDKLVARYAGSDAQRDAILNNRFYQYLSKSLAGSLEYMALEKVYELTHESQYDLVVLDTPPTVHALDFLEAPGRVLNTLTNDAVRWVTLPYTVAGKIGVKAASAGNSFIARHISRLTGTELLKSLAEMLVAFDSLWEGFQERARATQAMLRSAGTYFILVTAPGGTVQDEAVYFYERLMEGNYPFFGFIMNRMRPEWAAAGGQVPGDTAALAAWLGRFEIPQAAQIAREWAELAAAGQRLATADRGTASALGERCRLAPVFGLPQQPGAIHDLPALAGIGDLIAQAEPV